MIEKTVDIPTADGRMETFIAHPEEGGPFAPVVVYRQGRIRHQWRDPDGRMISMHNLDPERQAQVRAPLQKLSDAMVVADSGAMLDFIDRGEPVRPGGVGSIGYCMGGRHVICVAAAHPLRFIAAASLHGTQLVTDREASPHRLAPKLRGELYCGFAEKDPNATPPTRAALAEAFAGCPVDYRPVLHPGAEHGYALPDRDIHDKRAANRDWELIFAMFRRRLVAP